MRCLWVLILTAWACGALVSAQFVFAGVVDPHCGTDRSVDARSARTIVRDLVKPGMTNEQKALAVFHWLRRVIYHSGPEDPLRHDFNKMINIFGYGSCYQQTHPLSHLFAQMGFPCKDCMHDGHHMIEVFYDGAWHCLDPHMTFYVYNRARPPAIASIRELQEDPTLALEAVKQKRTGPSFLICGDSPKWFAGKGGQWVLDHAFTPHRGADEEFGAIRLARGMRYVRTWKTGKFHKPHAFDKDGAIGPYHTCGGASDRRDKVNFPYWEPYLWQGKRSSHRHHGTGFLEYAPDLRGGGWKDAAVRFTNLRGERDEKKPALHPADGAIPAEAIFFIDCPYIITGATMECRWSKGAKADEIVISVSREWAGRRRKWKQVWAAGGGEAPDSGAPAKLDLSAAVAGSVNGYWLRIVMRSGDPARTGIANLQVHTDFQLNPYVLPQLLPGENKLAVSAGRCSGPWKFRLAWGEGPNWQTPRQYETTIQGLQHEATVQVAGPKFPRMEAIEFSVDP